MFERRIEGKFKKFPKGAATSTSTLQPSLEEHGFYLSLYTAIEPSHPRLLSIGLLSRPNMDYRAALSRGHPEPKPKSLPPTNTSQFRKKSPKPPSKSVETPIADVIQEPILPAIANEPRKASPKPSARNLDDFSSSSPTNASVRRNSNPSSSKRPKRAKKVAVEEPKQSTFEKIKAMHQEKNAALLQKLQALSGSFDDSDDDDEDDDLYYGSLGDVLGSRHAGLSHLRSSDSSSASSHPHPPPTSSSSSSSSSLSSFTHLSSSVDSTVRRSNTIQEAVRCSICLNRVRSDQAVWQCDKCFCDAFHLSCIQGWINKEKSSSSTPSASTSTSSPSSSSSLSSTSDSQLDSSVSSSLSTATATSTAPVVVAVVEVAQSAAMLKFRSTYWQCPNCRGNHEFNRAPKDYYCFCGKVKDPPHDPWLAPHTCGNRCARSLECGHLCSEPCHVGRCSTCAVQSQHACYCGANSKMTRCIEKLWSCGERCGARLNCGKHRCALACHPGPCPPCHETSIQPCMCGAETKERSCLDAKWQCEKVCGASYGCEGYHHCSRVCHEPGNCGPCPLTLPRVCHCGKQTIPGTIHCKQVETNFGCGRTCQKPLSCGVHQCERKCHSGECGSCSQISMRYCACGKSRKETPCAVPFRCQKNCELMRSCGKHKCGTRCCPGKGACPPCVKICEKKLDCGICHCKRTCHDGLCDPCTQVRVNRCKCGFITETVPCSPKKVITHLVKKSCVGGHTTKMVDCGTPPYLECKRPCGNLLGCGNCVCEKPCHEKTRIRCLITVDVGKAPLAIETHAAAGHRCENDEYSDGDESSNEEEEEETEVTAKLAVKEDVVPLAPLRKAKDGTIYTPQRHQYAHLTITSSAEDTVYIPPNSTEDTCAKCTKKCLMGYLTCEHVHHGPCHLNDCPPCNHIFYMDCHCFRKRIQYECHELLDKDNFDAVVKSCKQPCPRKLPCSHMCTKLCHSGKCTEACMVQTRITCKCKTRKMDLPCHEVLKLRSVRKAVDNVLLDCEKECSEKKATKDAQKEMQREQKMKDTLEKEKKANEEAAARQRRGTARDIFHPTADSSQTSSLSATTQATSIPFRQRSSCKLSNGVKAVLYLALVLLFMVFIGVLIYLDKSKHLPTRRSW